MSVMDRLLNELDDSLYGTDTDRLTEKLKPYYRVVKHDGEKLPNIYHRLLRDKQFFSLFIRSPMGSGKTFQLKNIIRNFKRSAASTRRELKILIITPKRTFASYVGSQLPDFVDYRHIRKPYCFQKYPRMIVQLQSLRHFKDIENDTAYVRGYQMVIIDEIQSTIGELFSDLLSPWEKKKCISIFLKVLRAIPRWVCLDAHLSFDLIQIMKQIDDETEFDKSRICLINTFQHQNCKLIFHQKCLYSKLVLSMLRQKLMKSSRFARYKSLLSAQKIGNIVSDFSTDEVDRIYRKIYCRGLHASADSNDILCELHDLLTQGKKICVTTSTKQQAKLLKRLFRKTGFAVEAITGDTSEETKKSFAKDPDRFVRRCQLFIYTTAFQVGIDVSSSVPYFDTHFVFIESGVNVASPGAFVQAVGRIRNIWSNEIKVVVMDKNRKSERQRNLSFHDFIPLNDKLILPIDKNDPNVVRDLVDFHFREKSIGKSSTVYVAMFIKLLSCKSKAYVSINGNLYHSEDVVNFSNFHHSYEDYSRYVDEFVNRHADEIQNHLDKFLDKIWKKLETSSMFVSTLVNNYQAFVSLPSSMSRSECILKVCEFTSMPFGFLHTFLFNSVKESKQRDRYFEDTLSTFFHKADFADLKQLKSLLSGFFQCCRMSKSTHYQIEETRMGLFLQSFDSSIIHCYSKFVSSVISRSAEIRELFSKLLGKALKIYIHKNCVDLSEVAVYKRVINIDKLVEYNLRSHSETAENVGDNIDSVQN